jgi:hypothetical protein
MSRTSADRGPAYIGKPGILHAAPPALVPAMGRSSRGEYSVAIGIVSSATAERAKHSSAVSRTRAC